MKTLIIYESFFGNTEKIARAIAAALSTGEEIPVVAIANLTAEQLAAAELIIYGTPTRGFRPGDATKKWLAGLPAGTLARKKVAAFDTRIPVAEIKNLLLTVLVKIFGYAAKPLADGLVAKGGTLVAEPVGFIVNASEGPLRDGEIERAVAWAQAFTAKL